MTASHDEPSCSVFDKLVGRFRQQAWIDDPFAGFAAPARFEANSPVWPDSRWTRIEEVRETKAGKRTVAEFLYYRAESPDEPVPVGIVWDESQEDLRARVYFNKEFFGSEEPRRPILTPDEDIDVPEPLARYRAAIRVGDGPGLKEAVAADAEIHSPRGLISGAQFTDMFSHAPEGVKPGVPLQFATVTSANGTSACEFISWRRPPHAGLAVYTFGPSDGVDRVVQVRMYEGPVRR